MTTQVTGGADHNKPPVITTYLEMRSPAQLRRKTAGGLNLEVTERRDGDWRFNRDMYWQVGEKWSWTDKRVWSDAEWQTYALSPELRTFVAYNDGELVGYYELRDDKQHGVEIAYFGLLQQFIGRGLGGLLLSDAIEKAWTLFPGINRVWVHTCTLDHPGALANYKARGMTVYYQTAEVA
jgi:GNAT superfamily N-acetyltransferase